MSNFIWTIQHQDKSSMIVFIYIDYMMFDINLHKTQKLIHFQQHDNSFPKNTFFWVSCKFGLILLIILLVKILLLKTELALLVLNVTFELVLWYFQIIKRKSNKFAIDILLSYVDLRVISNMFGFATCNRRFIGLFHVIEFAQLLLLALSLVCEFV